VSQLKSWKILSEPDDEGGESEDEKSDDQVNPEVEEPPVQRKLTEEGSRPTRQKRVLKRFEDFKLM